MFMRRIYRGWLVVVASFTTYLVVWGGVWYSFSVFYRIFMQEFQWGRSETAGVFTLCAGLVFMNSPIVGRILEHRNPRVIMSLAAALLGFSLYMCSRIESLRGFYLFYGIGCSVGMSFLLFTSQTTIVSRWFRKYLATALGISLSGAGVGMVLVIPLVEYVIAGAGWRAGFLLLSALVLLLVLPASICLIRYPRKDELEDESSLLPWIPKERKGKQIVVVDSAWTEKEWRLTEALRTRRFWLLYLASLLGMALVVQTVFSHFVVMTTEMGYSPALSSKMLGLSGIMGTVGFLFWGRLGDHIGREWSYTLGTGSLILALLFLLAMNWVGGVPLFVLFSVFFGFGYGSRSPLIYSIWADVFLGPHFSAIFGMHHMLQSVAFMGPWLAGMVADMTNSYQPVIIVFLGFLTASCLLVWIVAPRRIRRIQ